MIVKQLVEKYVANTEEVFQQLEVQTASTEAEKVLNYAKRYLKDAKYYRDQKRFETALASVAYCEGLLDGLRLLGIVEFKWSRNK